MRIRPRVLPDPRRNTVSRLPLLALTAAGAVLGSATLRAQTAPPAVTRVDLAAAYQRIDRALTTATLDDTTRATVNRTFDRATLSFFGGRFAAAVAAIDSATRLVAPGITIPAPVAAPPAPTAPRVIDGVYASAVRARLQDRLGAIAARDSTNGRDTTAARRQVLASAAARAALLVDVPNPERSAEFLSDAPSLAKALAAEVDAIERGRDPYAHAAGDLWRVFRAGKNVPTDAEGALMVPFRLVASPAVASSARGVPVVFALHGAGGDENMFVDAYGAGMIATLAREKGFLLVSVATSAFAGSADNFDALLSLLRTEYAIDVTRVYVLGHSMGAGAASRLAQLRPQAIAAAVCLAGGSAVTVEGAPPVFYMSGELDPIIPAKSVQAAALRTPTGEFHLLPNQGHTLMVADGVKAGIPWLLARHR